MKTKKMDSSKKGTEERLPRGLFRRGRFLWVSKTINGERYQFSTGTNDVNEAEQALKDFLLAKGVAVESWQHRRKVGRGLLLPRMQTCPSRNFPDEPNFTRQRQRG